MNGSFVSTILIRHFSALFLAVVFCCSTFASGANAQNNQPTSEQVDAVLVLDVSGSMLLTDPLNLRQEGAKLFTQFLKKGDRLSIVTFSDTASVLKPLEPFDPSVQPNVNQIISGTTAKGEYTDLAAGIDKAISILQNNTRPNATQTIILMSDGKMEPSPLAMSAALLTNRLAEQTLPELRKNGIKLYTLAFSDQADQELLKEFAAITDGISWFTPTAEQIHESFANLFLAVKKPQVVPMTKRGFKIDPDVQEATFYINREGAAESVIITRPDGSTFGADTKELDVKWFKGQQFDVVTVVMPASGDWQIAGVANQDGFATVLTKLRLVSEWPSNIYAESKILLEARLYEEDKPISLPEMSGTIQFAFQITPTDKVSEPIIRDFLNDEGRDGDRIAKDGVFSKMVELEDAGEYKIRVLAKAPTFERNQQIPFRVKAPLVRVGVTEATDAIKKILQGPVSGTASGHDPHKETGHEKDSHDPSSEKPVTAQEAFEVILNEDAASYKKITLKLIAIDEKKSRFEIPLNSDGLSKIKQYSSVTLLPKEGHFTIQAVLSGETKRGQTVKSESKPITYHYSPIHGSHDEIQVVKKVEKPVEKAPPSPVLPIILMTILNAGAVFGVHKFLSKSSQLQKTEMPEFSSVAEAEELILSINTKLAVKDVDFTLPILQSMDAPLPPIWEGLDGIAAEATSAKFQQPQTNMEGPSVGSEGEAQADEQAQQSEDSEITSEAIDESDSTETDIENNPEEKS